MVETFTLRKPDMSLAKDIEAYRAEFFAADSSMDGSGPLRRMESAAEWLAFIALLEREETLPENMVVAEQFVYVRDSDQKIVGMIQYRHMLNEHLLQYGGHIGYSVRPGERRKGYATRMLAECLAYCRQCGLQRALITCKVENEASRRTILANGGIYENTTYLAAEDKHLQRYWIAL